MGTVAKSINNANVSVINGWLEKTIPWKFDVKFVLCA